IRPPLVYAGNAPGNFGRLLSLVRAGVPLPLGSVNNRRSMVALENLRDFIILCAEHPDAANELFLVSDGYDVSTADMVRHLAQGMGLRPRIFPFPESFIRLGATLLRKQALYTQLCDSLVVDSSKARMTLGWKPEISVVDALRKAGKEFVQV